MSNTTTFTGCACGTCLVCTTLLDLADPTERMPAAWIESVRRSSLPPVRRASGESAVTSCLCTGGVDDLGRACPFCRRDSSIPPPPEAA